MAISGKETIQIGLQNESTGSDSLYTAFNKTANNFTTLFNSASPYNTFTGNGVSINANSTAGTVDITNTGVTNIIAGTGIVLSSGNGNVTISSTGGGGGNGGGTVTSVGVVSSTLSVNTTTGGNIVSSGNLIVNLSNTGVTGGTYTYPTVGVDQYGRITSIANGNSVGTVTSVGIIADTGIQVSGSPVTTSGSMTILNTGVTRINPGTGITVSGSNGNVTISSTVGGGTVTSVNVTSSTLTVSGGPIVTSGTISVELPSAISITGNVTSGNIVTGGLVTATGNVRGANLITTGLISATGNITGGNIVTAGRITSSSSSAGIGYSTGAGNTVSQGTSRTTTVVINALSGAITLFSAAGTSSYTTFTVTNSSVADTDVIIVNQKSGTDKYETFVSNVATGSFNITFSDVSGTTTESPVFNFAVIKAVAA